MSKSKSEKQTLGAYLMALRKENKQSLQAVGESTGMVKSAVWTIEQDSPDIRLSTAKKLARHFGVSVDQLAERMP